jgi:hypothetical protein
MTTLTAKDVRARPGEFFIVVRSARGHAHLAIDDFDNILEGIGDADEIKKRVEPSSQPDSASYEDLLRMIQTIAHQVDMHATMIANQAVAIEQQQSIIDAILNAKIPLDVKQERVA